MMTRCCYLRETSEMNIDLLVIRLSFQKVKQVNFTQAKSRVGKNF